MLSGPCPVLLHSCTAAHRHCCTQALLHTGTAACLCSVGPAEAAACQLAGTLCQREEGGNLSSSSSLPRVSLQTMCR